MNQASLTVNGELRDMPLLATQCLCGYRADQIRRAPFMAERYITVYAIVAGTHDLSAQSVTLTHIPK